MNIEMNSKERRAQILELISNTDKPLSGTNLGKMTGVSRQIVVQDIALLRTEGYSIISTARGYMLSKDSSPACLSRVIKVCHTDDQVEEELQTIIDLGGTVIDVIVNHRTYGKVSASLNIKSRRDINKFMDDLKSSKSSLLSNVTSGYHFHTICADEIEILDEIEKALLEKGFLAPVMDYEEI